MSDQEPSEQTKIEHTKRESESLTIVGGFLIYLSVIVLIAAFMQAPGHARWVNLGASLVLMCIGLGMVFGGRRLRRRVR